MGYWDDYVRKRPFTWGGETAIRDAQPKPLPLPPAPRPWGQAPTPPRPSKPEPVPLTRGDLAIAAVVWLVAWMILWRSTDMGGLGSACVAIFPAGIAAKWWKQLLTAAIVMGVLWLLFMKHAK